MKTLIEFEKEYAELEATVKTIDDVKRCASEKMNDDEFGKALTDQFPEVGGMADFEDVRDFIQNWHDKDCDDESVDLICQIMEFVYEQEPISWYSCELSIVDRNGNQHNSWTANFISAEACKSDVLENFRHCTVGHPKMYKDVDGVKTFIEEIDMRTPEQIEYFNTPTPLQVR